MLTLLEISNHILTKHPETVGYLQEITYKGMGVPFEEWARGDFAVPCPKPVKDSVLRRHNLPNSTWIETGTFHGETSEMLSKIALRVFTIEPEPKLFARAKEKFSANPSITVINQISEIALPNLLPQIDGNVCFWLDGHYSAGETFAGPNDTPLVHELGEIEKHLARFSKVLIAIDDIRLCGKRHAYGEYPSLDHLVNWARDNKLGWNIEYDIFLMWK